MKLAVIILNYKTPKLVISCIESIKKNKWKNEIEIWAVDNDSGDNSLEIIKKEFKNIRFIQSDSNIGFAGGNNLALKEAKADYYMLLNSDTKVNAGSLDTMLEVIEKNRF